MKVANGSIMCGNWATCSSIGVVWAMCMWGVVVDLSWCAPTFASVFIVFFTGDVGVGSFFLYEDIVWGPIYLVHNCYCM